MRNQFSIFLWEVTADELFFKIIALKTCWQSLGNNSWQSRFLFATEQPEIFKKNSNTCVFFKISDILRIAIFQNATECAPQGAIFWYILWRCSKPLLSIFVKNVILDV